MLASLARVGGAQRRPHLSCRYLLASARRRYRGCAASTFTSIMLMECLPYCHPLSGGLVNLLINSSRKMPARLFFHRGWVFNMDPIGAGSLHGLHLFAEPREIGREDRWRDDDRPFHHGIMRGSSALYATGRHCRPLRHSSWSAASGPAVPAV